MCRKSDHGDVFEKKTIGIRENTVRLFPYWEKEEEAFSALLTRLSVSPIVLYRRGVLPISTKLRNWFFPRTFYLRTWQLLMCKSHCFNVDWFDWCVQFHSEEYRGKIFQKYLLKRKNIKPHLIFYLDKHAFFKIRRVFINFNCCKNSPCAIEEWHERNLSPRRKQTWLWIITPLRRSVRRKPRHLCHI